MNFRCALLFGLVAMTGCALPEKAPENTAQFSDVPGPSRTTATLPAVYGKAPTPPVEERKVTVEKKAGPKKIAAPKPEKPVKPPIVTPDQSTTGKVVRYNDRAQFVVLEFPLVNMPAVGQQLFLYRNDLKVGEVKITGPQKEAHIVADLTSGEAQAGDTVRNR